MSQFSRPDRNRINVQAEQIFQYAGNTATLRTFVSAVTGVPDAGIGSAVYYAQRTITAQFMSLPSLPENVGGAGLIAAGQFQMVSREKVGRQDELLWRTSTYRIDSDPVPSNLPGWWVTILKRASE